MEASPSSQGLLRNLLLRHMECVITLSLVVCATAPAYSRASLNAGTELNVIG